MGIVLTAMGAGTRVPSHARSPEDVCLELGSDPERGLSVEAAVTRLVTAGPNRLPAPERPAYVAIALRQLADPLVALLLGAAVVSAAIGEQLEAAAIAAIVVLNAVLGSSRKRVPSAPSWRSGARCNARPRSFATGVRLVFPSRTSFPEISSSSVKATASPRTRDWSGKVTRAITTANAAPP